MKDSLHYEEELEIVEMERDRLLAVAAAEEDGTDDITAFAERHGLEQRLDVLQEAASLIRRGDDSHTLDASTSKWSQPLALYLCIAATALGSMSQGWAQTGINGANIYFPKLFRIDPLTVGFINCAIYLSNGLLGSWLVAPLNKRLGRRGAVFIGTLILIIFNLGGSAAQNWQTLLFCRLALGVGLGIINATLNIFAAECAPAAIRGGLAVSWQMFCAFGIFLGFLTNMLVDGNPELFGPLRWRIMLLAAAIPNAPLLFWIFLCPDSPAFHIKVSGNYGRAFDSLCRLRNTEVEAARQLLILYGQQKHETKGTGSSSSYLTMTTELFTIPRIRRATLASYMTMLAQQFCGINIVAFYSSTIFVEAHFSPHAAEAASTIFGFVNFLGAFPAIWTMDTLGRRSLLLLTLPVMGVCLAVAGVSFSITNASMRIGMAAGMIYLFCLLYSPGMGPVPPAYAAEVYPLSHRELGASSAIAVNNLFAAVLSLTFPWLLDRLGTQGSFLLYAFLNLVGWTLVYLFVPETKKRSLEELDEVFSIPTGRFVRYQVKYHAPWWIRRHLLRRKGEDLDIDIYQGGQYKAVNDISNED